MLPVSVSQKMDLLSFHAKKKKKKSRLLSVGGEVGQNDVRRGEEEKEEFGEQGEDVRIQQHTHPHHTQDHTK